MTIRTYTELSKLKTFKERYEYLKLNGKVAEETFGYERYLNQMLYNNVPEWKHIRDKVIIRDNGCDLGADGHDIRGRILVHHMNPITADDIVNRRDYVLDPEYLITTTLSTHNAIHYGSFEQLVDEPIERSKNDTCPWKR